MNARLDALPPRRLVLVALLGGVIFQLLLGTSYVAAFLDPVDESRGVPVAIVNEDEGDRAAAFIARLNATDSPVAWVLVDSRAAAETGLADKSFRGALVFPRNFSAAIGSFRDQEPRAALVEATVSPGTTRTGALVAERVMELGVHALTDIVRERALANATVADAPLGPVGALTVDQARWLARPVVVEWRTVNPIPPGGAGGLAPVYLAMGAWMGGYVGAVALERFRERTRLPPGTRALVVAGAAVAHAGLATGAVLLVGASVPDALLTASVVALGVWMAYAVVGVATDVLGIAGAVPAFALLALGIPASGGIYPVEMLPPFYATLHAVNPFTWLVEALRTTLYTPAAGDLAGHALRLALLALAATGVSLAWARVRPREARLTPTGGAGTLK